MERDDETGLSYHSARYYVPWLGRWASVDPVGLVDGLNLYQYSRNNPILLSDPSGMDSGLTATEGGIGITINFDENTRNVERPRVGRIGGQGPYPCDDLSPGCNTFEPPSVRDIRNDLGAATSGRKIVERIADIDFTPSDSNNERSFFSRGGTGLVLGGTTTIIGVAILASNPIGWATMLVGALALAGGIATTTASGVQLGVSYSGNTTTEQDLGINDAIGTTLSLSSPGGLLGGTIGAGLYGEEGLSRGAFYGGLTEAAVGILKSGSQIISREFKFGIPSSPKWDSVRPAIQGTYDLAETAARVRPNPAFPRGIERIDLSHWIPQRWTRGTSLEWITNRPWNVTPMWAGEHALIDPFRLKFIKQPWRDLYEAQQVTGLSQQIQLMPPSLFDFLANMGFGATRHQTGTNN
jgi:RHS repeat-associated protein